MKGNGMSGRSMSTRLCGLCGGLLLAAAAGPPARRIVDVGSGVGAVALALLKRWPEACGELVEIDPALAALAREIGRAHV